MSHHHSHSHHGHEGQDGAEKNISIAFFLNAFFVVVEVVGGLLTNSIAILTDALHDFGDCLSLATAWFLQKKSKKGRDRNYSYGYKRFSLLGSIFLSGVLTVSSIFVIVEAVKRVIAPEAVEAQGMMWIAIFGIVINGAAALRVKRGSSINEKAVYLHIMEDVLGWIAVLVVSIVMQFVNFPILDPLLSIAISIWVLTNVYKNLRVTFKILLQGVPEDVNIENLKSELQLLDGVGSLHDMHIWSLDGETHVMTLHVVCSNENSVEIKKEIQEIARKHQIVHTTIEMEGANETCGCNCDKEGIK